MHSRRSCQVVLNIELHRLSLSVTLSLDFRRDEVKDFLSASLASSTASSSLADGHVQSKLRFHV